MASVGVVIPIEHAQALHAAWDAGNRQAVNEMADVLIDEAQLRLDIPSFRELKRYLRGAVQVPSPETTGRALVFYRLAQRELIAPDMQEVLDLLAKLDDDEAIHER